MSSTEQMSAAARFRQAVERKDIAAVGELFSADIVFHSPNTFHPFIGRDMVVRVLAEVVQVFEGLHYTDELETGGVHGLIFRASVAGKEIEGIDLLRIDSDGLIADFTVMLRPLSAVVPFAQAMGERAVAAGLETTRQ